MADVQPARLNRWTLSPRPTVPRRNEAMFARFMTPCEMECEKRSDCGEQSLRKELRIAVESRNLGVCPSFDRATLNERFAVSRSRPARHEIAAIDFIASGRMIVDEGANRTTHATGSTAPTRTMQKIVITGSLSIRL